MPDRTVETGAPAATRHPWRKRIGLPLGPLVFTVVLLLPGPDDLAPEAQRAGAVAALMAIWWITEALPLAATALVPLALYPLGSILPMSDTAKRYGDPNVFLFMGGFMIAMAMQKWGLHRRIALHVLSVVGGGPRRVVGGFMVAAAFLSMWVSNTATAVLMLPIGMAVIGRMEQDGDGETASRFGLTLMLAIAYSATLGGVATLIGTPPNVIFAGQVSALFPELGDVGFLRWMLLALPLSVGFLLIVWVYLVFGIGRLPRGVSAGREVVREELRRLGPWSRGEIAVMIVFVATALAWITRSDLRIGGFVLQGWSTRLGLEGVHDGTVAILATLVLFAVPVSVQRMEFVLDWSWARRIPWGVLLLFGGGFALAESFKATGLAAWLGGGFTSLEGLPTPVVILLLCLSVTFLTEVTSNTATASMLMPVLAAASVALQVHPYLLMIPATLSASFAFMLPVATPPNAIVFGSGRVTIPQMARAGLVLNLAGALWITLVVWVLVGPIFGLGPMAAGAR